MVRWAGSVVTFPIVPAPGPGALLNLLALCARAAGGRTGRREADGPDGSSGERLDPRTRRVAGDPHQSLRTEGGRVASHGVIGLGFPACRSTTSRPAKSARRTTDDSAGFPAMRSMA